MKTVKRLQYKLRELKAGSLFGYEELLLSTKRKCRVRCSSICEVIYINKSEFYAAFPKVEVEKLRRDLKEVDLD